ncbi:MAG: PEGA domain-containing protein [Candidatus Roizmanbacteria bacterium]
MKTRILYLIFLVLLAGVGTFLKIYVYDRQKASPGNIQIVSVPESSVFINTQAVGRTPFNQPYTPGVYAVKLIPLSTDNTATSSAVTWEGKVEVRSRQYTYIRRELANTEIESAGEVLTIRPADLPLAAGTGDIEIQTDPPGAVVSLDGEDVGVSPHVIRGASVGAHEVSLYLSKLKRRTILLNIESGGYTTLLNTNLGLDVDFDKKFELSKLLEASGSARLPDIPKLSPTTTPMPAPKSVLIQDTSTGFLRVRDAGSLAGKEIAQVKPGETYTFIEEKGSWIKIKLSTAEGWVSAEFVKKVY